IAVKDTMNAMKLSMEKQVALFYDVSVAITFNLNLKRIEIVNNGRTNVYIWGDRLNRGKKVMDRKPRMITPGGSYYVLADSFYEELRQKLPKGSEGRIPFELFLKNEAGDSFAIETEFFSVWDKD